MLQHVFHTADYNHPFTVRQPGLTADPNSHAIFIRLHTTGPTTATQYTVRWHEHAKQARYLGHESGGKPARWEHAAGANDIGLD